MPPALWGCRPHWYSLPLDLRRGIWRAYRPGQEATGRPDGAYIAAARAVQDWIATHHPETRKHDAHAPQQEAAPAVPAAPGA